AAAGDARVSARDRPQGRPHQRGAAPDQSHAEAALHHCPQGRAGALDQKRPDRMMMTTQKLPARAASLVLVFPWLASFGANREMCCIPLHRIVTERAWHC